MSIELLKSISTQKAHTTCYKQGSILHYLGTNQGLRLSIPFGYSHLAFRTYIFSLSAFEPHYP